MDEEYKRAFLDVLSSFVVARTKAIEKHGNHNYPDGINPDLVPLLEVMEKRCSRATKAGTCTWSEVMTEEVLEALTETDDKKLEAELIQVGAVAAAWVLCIRRRRKLFEPSTPVPKPIPASRRKTVKKLPRPEDGLPSPYREAE